MSPDTELIVKAAVGSGLVCGFIFCAAAVVYFFQIECRPRPRIRRARRREVHPLWILGSVRGGGTAKAAPTLTAAEIEALFPARPSAAGGHTVCSVCLDTLGPGHSARRLVCEHEFHTHCIDPWLTTNATCPTCRTQAATDAAPPEAV
ncbi:hypothetical protein H4R21_002147 [Coemansia helicoidea]|uniref:Uncharacterized protein n=1 Tax=Coemansia helicoidea TaxID=1286919 RepID=A0ACC1L7T6_9FUNG|nr:hypothetical protein H4R21_002147 [Coemansia helicoidea]